jgi:hypothetical protein
MCRSAALKAQRELEARNTREMGVPSIMICLIYPPGKEPLLPVGFRGCVFLIATVLAAPCGWNTFYTLSDWLYPVPEQVHNQGKYAKLRSNVKFVK